MNECLNGTAHTVELWTVVIVGLVVAAVLVWMVLGAIKIFRAPDEADDAEEDSPEESPDVSARLAELRLLEDGWMGSKSEALSEEGLDWFERAFHKHFPDDLPSPYLYAMVEGGIQAEWFGPRQCTLEVDLVTHQGKWHSLDASSEEASLNLDEPEGWGRLGNKLRATEKSPDGLTDEERQVSESLIEAWNGFIKLPVQHSDDVEEFRHDLHRLQHLLMIRSVRREHSYWTNEQRPRKRE